MLLLFSWSCLTTSRVYISICLCDGEYTFLPHFSIKEWLCDGMNSLMYHPLSFDRSNRMSAGHLHRQVRVLLFYGIPEQPHTISCMHFVLSTLSLLLPYLTPNPQFPRNTNCNSHKLLQVNQTCFLLQALLQCQFSSQYIFSMLFQEHSFCRHTEGVLQDFRCMPHKQTLGPARRLRIVFARRLL